MATEVKRARSALCEADFHAWAKEQAALLRAGRFQELDLENLIEEVEDLGGAMKRFVRSRARRIMEHLLKLQHSPAAEPRLGWCETVRTQRSELLNDLTPSLRRVLEDELPAIYDRARHDAAGSLRDHGEYGAADALPETCAYTLDQITGDWLPRAGPGVVAPGTATEAQGARMATGTKLPGAAAAVRGAPPGVAIAAESQTRQPDRLTTAAWCH